MKNVYLIDIDGVLADYAQAFCKYHNWLLYKKLKSTQLAKLPFNEHLKYDKKLYDCVKYLFRISGGEALSPNLIKESKEFIDKVKKRGDVVIIWTARPTEEFPNLKLQTKIWLRKNKIKYDKLFFVEKGFDKEMFLVNSNLLLKYCLKNKYKIIAVDDRRLSPILNKFIDEIYLFDRNYNKQLKGRRIKSLSQLL